MASLSTMMKKLLVAAFAALSLASTVAQAAGGGHPWDRFPTERVTDVAALQNGTKLFVNYCLNCHAASYMRFNRLRDIGLTEQQIILYASRIQLYITLEQYAQAREELNLLDDARFNFDFDTQLVGVLGQLAEGELLLVERAALEARQVFEAARLTARDVLRDNDIEARACLGIARSYTIEAQIEAT